MGACVKNSKLSRSETIENRVVRRGTYPLPEFVRRSSSYGDRCRFRSRPGDRGKVDELVNTELSLQSRCKEDGAGYYNLDRWVSTCFKSFYQPGTENLNLKALFNNVIMHSIIRLKAQRPCGKKHTILALRSASNTRTAVFSRSFQSLTRGNLTLDEANHGPLKGVRVLDLTRVLAVSVSGRVTISNLLTWHARDHFVRKSLRIMELMLLK